MNLKKLSLIFFLIFIGIVILFFFSSYASAKSTSIEGINVNMETNATQNIDITSKKIYDLQTENISIQKIDILEKIKPKIDLKIESVEFENTDTESSMRNLKKK